MPERSVVDVRGVEPVTFRQRQRAARQRFAQRRRGGGPPRWPGEGDGIALTPADQRLLAALPRYGVMSWRQAQRFFYGTEHRTAMRLSALRDAGLVDQSPHEGWAGKVLWATATTAQLVRAEAVVPLPATVTAAKAGDRLLHRLAVTDVGLKYEETGRTVLTEREVRACEQGDVDPGQVADRLGADPQPVYDFKGRRRYFVTPVSTDDSVMIPDLVVVHDGGRLRAVEVELAVKERARVHRLLRGYASHSPFAEVQYFTTPDVRMAMCGWWPASGGPWRQGWLHELGLVSPQVPWEQQPREVLEGCPVKVAALSPEDRGVAWRLDMRVTPEHMWVTKREWGQLRQLWATHDSAKQPDGSRIEFTVWWASVYPKVKAQEAAHLREQYRPNLMAVGQVQS